LGQLRRLHERNACRRQPAARYFERFGAGATLELPARADRVCIAACAVLAEAGIGSGA
jgi:hypothetical protein